jgi:hypothetical protein
MADHQFIVTVHISGWAPLDGRSEQDYARTALWVADLPEARRLDGYGDLSAEADITGVEEL